MTIKKNTQLPRSPLPYDSEYDSFVQGLELIGLALKNSRCDLDRRAFFSLKEHSRAFTHKYRLTDFGEGSFDAEGDFGLSISESPETAPPLKMDCVFEVHFHANSLLTEGYAERFIGNELRLILVPHARQFFLMLSGQMGIPPVIAPLTTGPEQTGKKQIRKPKGAALIRPNTAIDMDDAV